MRGACEDKAYVSRKYFCGAQSVSQQCLRLQGSRVALTPGKDMDCPNWRIRLRPGYCAGPRWSRPCPCTTQRPSSAPRSPWCCGEARSCAREIVGGRPVEGPCAIRKAATWCSGGRLECAKCYRLRYRRSGRSCMEQNSSWSAKQSGWSAMRNST